MKKLLFILYLLLITSCQNFISFEKDANDANDIDDIDNNQQDLANPESKIQGFAINIGKIKPDFASDIFLYDIIIPENIEVSASILLPENLSSFKIDNFDIEDFSDTFTYNFSYDIQFFTIFCTSQNTLNTSEYTFNILKAENSIFNSDFEIVSDSAPLGWTMKSAGLLTAVSDDLSGLYSAAFNSLTQAVDGREALSNPILYNTGSDILLSADIFIPHLENIESSDVRFSLKLFFFADEECKIPAQKGFKTLNSVTPARGCWENIKLICKADELSEDTLYIRAAFRACYVAGVGTKDSVHRFDNVYLYQF